MLEKIVNGTKDFCKKVGRTGLILTALYAPFQMGCGINDGNGGVDDKNVIQISVWEQNIPANPQVGVAETYLLTITNLQPDDQTLFYHIDWDYDGTFVADESVGFTVFGSDFVDYFPTHTFTTTGAKTSRIKVDLASGETIDIDNEADYMVTVDP